jgi:hypothetical protein
MSRNPNGIKHSKLNSAPVLPLVGSISVSPGLMRPDSSASSTIRSAMRSLIDPPALKNSHLAPTTCSPRQTRKGEYRCRCTHKARIRGLPLERSCPTESSVCSRCAQVHSWQPWEEGRSYATYPKTNQNPVVGAFRNRVRDSVVRVRHAGHAQDQ